jgi:predicted ATPase
LNQLPDVRKFVLESGNADIYIGLHINFIPHKSPVFVMFGDDDTVIEEIDMAPLSFNDLVEMVESRGFKKKEML